MLKPYGARSALAFVIASRVSDVLDRWPNIYLALLRLRLTETRNRIVTADHVMVLEAFPRSGSSFSHQAFEQANPDAHGRVASHIHRSSQVIRAARLGLPTIVLVREPRAAVTSLLALGIQQGQLLVRTPADARRCMAAALHRYAVFHERVVDVPEVLIASFEDVTGDLDQVIERINARFGTVFAMFGHTDDAVAALMASARKHLGPNAERDRIKATVAEAYNHPALGRVKLRAEAAYAAMIARRDGQLAEQK
jgi:hypothetical protein